MPHIPRVLTGKTPRILASGSAQVYDDPVKNDDMPKQGERITMRSKPALWCIILFMAASTATGAVDKPNIIFLPVDDLNDWIGCMGGHPQAKTPHIDNLASRGVLFANGHCQSPVCNPSRASLMTSLYPSTSGIYFLNPDPMDSPVVKKATFLPKRFENEGYHVSGAGKMFHGGQNRKYWPNWVGNFGGVGPFPRKKLCPFKGHKLWDWGVFPEQDEQMPDFKTAAWAVNALKQKYEKPFFLAAGFARPHVPQYAPQKWFDLYPLDTLKLPSVLENDIKDVSQYGINITRLKHVAPTHEWVVKSDEWKPLVQSYLACVSFVDDQVGKIVRALDNSPYKDNTYIILFTDHGFHLGEKERWAKRSLWEDGTRTPMIIAGPGIVKGKICNKPVQLLDIYPTLLALTGLEPDPKHEGHSLEPLLKNPDAAWAHMARTSFGPGNYAIVSERYRYIHYNDGTEEFYDRRSDANEWHNQVKNPEYAEEVERHREKVPKERHQILGKGSTGHHSFTASEALRKNTE